MYKGCRMRTIKEGYALRSIEREIINQLLLYLIKQGYENKSFAQMMSTGGCNLSICNAYICRIVHGQPYESDINSSCRVKNWG